MATKNDSLSGYLAALRSLRPYEGLQQYRKVFRILQSWRLKIFEVRTVAIAKPSSNQLLVQRAPPFLIASTVVLKILQ